MREQGIGIWTEGGKIRYLKTVSYTHLDVYKRQNLYVWNDRDAEGSND